MMRMDDPTYRYHSMFRDWLDTVAGKGLTWLPTGNTWTSMGKFGGIHRVSTIDHAYVTGPLWPLSTVELLDSAPADHAPLLIKISMGGSQRRAIQTIQRRNYTNIDYNMLDTLLACADWLPASSGFGNLVQQYNNTTLSALDSIAPVETIQVREGSPLYLEQDTRAAMAERDQARPGKKHKALRNKVNRLVKRDHVKSAVKTLQRNVDPWKLANSMLGKGMGSLPLISGASTNHEAANIMNQFYINKPDRLRRGLPDIDREGTERLQEAKRIHFQNTTHDVPPFELHAVGVVTIKRVIRSLKSTMAAGTDQIPFTLIKRCLSSMAQPLCHIVNASIRESRFPDEWRTSIVHPVFKGKGKDRLLPDSYRPVSILNAASKVLEKVVETQLVAHMEEWNLLPEQQHGFRKNRSTDTALTRMTHFLESARQRKDKAFVASFDFSAAFDTVDPGVVVDALRKLGAVDRTMDWFNSYLLPGQQQVCWNGELSDVLLVVWGVRQGSILGPVLFIIVTRNTAGILVTAAHLELGLTEHYTIAVLYADDTSLGVAAKATHDAMAALTAASNIMVKYATELGLAINADKTQFLSLSHGEPALLRVRYDYVRPGPLSFLGATFSETRGLIPFVEDTASALCRTAGVVRNISARLPQNVLTLLANALGVGKARVSIAAANNLRTSHADPINTHTANLQKSLNNVARSALGKQRKDRITVESLMDQCRFPSVNRMVATNAGLMAWHALRGNGVLRDLFDELHHNTRTRAADSNLLKTPLVWCTPILNAVKVWNACTNLRAANSAQAAKTTLKKWSRLLPV
jgi:hypothetical protein